MNIKLIMALALGALFIAAPGCSTTRCERKGPAHMHHRPGSNVRKRIHRHTKHTKSQAPTEVAPTATEGK